MRIVRLFLNGLMSLSVAAVFVMLFAGAGPVIPTVADSSASSDSVRTLTFEWAAANMALQPPYDTVQLQAIPRTASGAVVPGLSVQYSASNTTAISVSATGLVTARVATGGAIAHVIASVTQGGRTLTDTARIQVTEKPLSAPLATLSIQPQPGGLTSAHGNLENTDFTMPVYATFPFFATMATGNPATDTVCNVDGCKHPLLVHFTSSDPSIAYIDDAGGLFYPLQTGRVTFAVSTIAYGVRKRDSLLFSVGYIQRVTTELYVDHSHQPPELAIFRGAPPYSVGLHIYITNRAKEPVELRLPAHGVRLVTGDKEHVVPAFVDTIADQPNNMTTVVLDSVGTHVLQYHGLHTGTTLSDTITVLPYP